ncbi:MAG: hypothetical protein FWC64_02630 [Treponema sp.]|nr:hypothetical protein [Treponema sp.]
MRKLFLLAFLPFLFLALAGCGNGVSPVPDPDPDPPGRVLNPLLVGRTFASSPPHLVTPYTYIEFVSSTMLTLINQYNFPLENMPVWSNNGEIFLPAPHDDYPVLLYHQLTRGDFEGALDTAIESGNEMEINMIMTRIARANTGYYFRFTMGDREPFTGSHFFDLFDWSHPDWQ